MKTNFDICCESIENMAQMIDIMKCGWTKDQIKIWLKQPCTENECESLAEYEDIGFYQEQTKEGYLSGLELVQIWAELKKLKEYRRLEEQGKLPRLPCAVGDEVYRINKGKREPVIPMRVIGIAIRDENELVIQTKDIDDDGHNLYSQNSIGKIVFLTREEAEAVLM